jgi:hypothetical protein
MTVYQIRKWESHKFTFICTQRVQRHPWLGEDPEFSRRSRKTGHELQSKGHSTETLGHCLCSWTWLSINKNHLFPGTLWWYVCKCEESHIQLGKHKSYKPLVWSFQIIPIGQWLKENLCVVIVYSCIHLFSTYLWSTNNMSNATLCAEGTAGNKQLSSLFSYLYSNESKKNYKSQ